MTDEQVTIIKNAIKEKVKESLSDLEKDILDTADEILKKPFDYNSASLRLSINFMKYRIVDWVRESQPQAQWKTLSNEDEVLDNLRLQLAYLYKKYTGEQNNG